jgi:hypothetical protein
MGPYYHSFDRSPVRAPILSLHIANGAGRDENRGGGFQRKPKHVGSDSFGEAGDISPADNLVSFWIPGES